MSDARRFVVWDPSDTDEDGGLVVETAEEEFEAAELYAQRDHDNGNYEGVGAYELRVRCPTGEVVDIVVDVDFDPVFSARPA